MPDPIYYTLDDIAARWDVARRTVQRRIHDPHDPHPLIARKFGSVVRVRHDDLLAYEEQHIVARARPKPRKTRAHTAVTV